MGELDEPVPSETQLRDAIVEAARAAFSDLFETHSNEHFYYCSLVTTGQGHPPTVTAWSREALAAEARRTGYGMDDLKWSYADSPYHLYGEHYFDDVNRLFAARPSPPLGDSDAWVAEVDLRLAAMEAAMAQLDREGLFGVGRDRLGIFINVEVMPPDYTNVERARRLNPPEALREWLTEEARVE